MTMSPSVEPQADVTTTDPADTPQLSPHAPDADGPAPGPTWSGG